MKNIFSMTFMAIFAFIMVACGEKENQEQQQPVEQLGDIASVSLDSKAQSASVTLSRDVSSENVSLSTKDNAYWIKNLKANGNTISFNVEENPNVSTGHRFDTVIINVGNQTIGKFCVSQARTRKSTNKLAWANSSAKYSQQRLPTDMTGKELTEFIYRLEQTTNGEDSYHNYPAFEYVIEMNHDPANNMEWHLGTNDEIPDMRLYSQFADGYYWQADDQNGTYARVFKYNTGATSRLKTEINYVYAMRNGSMDLE